ncbi:MAG: MXAN_6577-like cysteine-rich protein [Myxococcaceae bacterium]
MRSGALAAHFAVLLTACPKREPRCNGSLQACGSGACVDFNSDSRNCGSCGTACQTGQSCVCGACQCKEGSSLCAGQCVATQSDALHCGACGNACPGNQVCEQGQCRATCTLTRSTLCGASCVDISSDSNHCGACDQACVDTQSCRSGGCSYDVVASNSAGQVVGMQASTGNLGPAAQMGAVPQALASFPRSVLTADGIENQLRHARLPNFAEVQSALATSASPNHILIDRPYVYVVTSTANTLMVFREGAADSGGVSALSFVKEISLGNNTSPQLAVKVGDALYLPLFGGADPSGGQKVLRVDVTDPTNPVVGASIDLAGIDLKPFDGGMTLARPYGAASRANALYVSLANLDSNFVVGGPAMLAKIDLGSGNTVTAVELPQDKCLNPGWLATSADGTTLYVSCGGRVTRDSDFNALSSESAGIVALAANDSVRASWSAACPTGVNGCAIPNPGRFARQGNRLFVADQTAGRVWILEDNGASLVERRGYADGGTPVTACGLSAGGYITDIVAAP